MAVFKFMCSLKTIHIEMEAQGVPQGQTTFPAGENTSADARKQFATFRIPGFQNLIR